MTKLQSILDLAQRMLHANLDEIAVAEVLVSEIQTHITNLKCEAFDSLPVVHVEEITRQEDDRWWTDPFWTFPGRKVCQNTKTFTE